MSWLRLGISLIRKISLSRIKISWSSSTTALLAFWLIRWYSNKGSGVNDLRVHVHVRV